jgi:type II secretory pathway pseudopilin PulG
LVELVVVILIIGVLASLTAGGIFQVIDGQRQANTEQTIRTVSQDLRKQWDALLNQAKVEGIPQDVLNIAGQNAQGPNGQVLRVPDRARIIWLKLRLKQEFPTNFTEAGSPSLNNDGITKNNYITSSDLPGRYPNLPVNAGLPLATSVQAEQSAICLLLALERNRGVKFNPDDLGSTVVVDSKNYANISTKQPLQEMVDNWGGPLAYNRWPTLLPFANANNPSFWNDVDGSNPAGSSAQLRDPLDPEGLLMDSNWYNSTDKVTIANTTLQPRVEFENICHSVSNASSSGPQSYYIVPVISSKRGNPNYYVTGDLYSYNLRLAAKGS